MNLKKTHTYIHKTEVKLKKAFKIVAAVAVIAVCVFSATFVLPKVLNKGEDTAEYKHPYTGVLEMWNVQSFEGGCGSRSGWLTSRAAKFEKTHSGLFVHVTDLTAEQAKAKLEGGDIADIVAFPRGVGNLLNNKLVPLDMLTDVRQNFCSACVYGGKTLCLPLYTGGYFLFARTQDLGAKTLPTDVLSLSRSKKVGKNTIKMCSLVCGEWDFGSPLTALSMSGVAGNTGEITKTTQYSAYTSFLADNVAVALLGSQRDLVRLSQKQDNGKISPLTVLPLADYTDLVQFVGVSSSSQNVSAAKEFVNFLLGDDVQKTLSAVGLFSATKIPLYSDGLYAQAEKAWENAYVPNAFADESTIDAQRKTATSTLQVFGKKRKSDVAELCFSR